MQNLQVQDITDLYVFVDDIVEKGHNFGRPSILTDSEILTIFIWCGKNWQGWHFGFKLHASINPRGQLCGLHFTPASFHDAQSLPYLVKGNAKIVVGDGTYNARVMRERLWKESGVFVLAPPHPKQENKIMTWWQKRLLEGRPKIESVFDILKEHCHLVTSFPRSVLGYLFHYLRVLLGYQLSRAIT